MILGHNVECTAAMPRLPILMLECSKGSHLERRACLTGLTAMVATGGTFSSANFLYGEKNMSKKKGFELVYFFSLANQRTSCTDRLLSYLN